TISVSVGTALPEPEERVTPVLALRNANPNGTGIDGITDQEDHGPEDEQRFDPEGQDIEPREEGRHSPWWYRLSARGLDAAYPTSRTRPRFVPGDHPSEQKGVPHPSEQKGSLLVHRVPRVCRRRRFSALEAG